MAAAAPKPELPPANPRKPGKGKKVETANSATAAQTGFQRTDVNASGDAAKVENENSVVLEQGTNAEVLLFDLA